MGSAPAETDVATGTPRRPNQERGLAIEAARQRVVHTAQRLIADGLIIGTQGNVSVRIGADTVALSPSSVPYDQMTSSDVVVCAMDGTVIDGDLAPTSEKDLHLAVLAAYPEVGSVVHMHPLYASMFALVHEPVPAVIEEVAMFVGGDVPCAAWKPSGSSELAEEVTHHLRDRSAVLMANHGMCCVGADADGAVHAAGIVERTAHIVWGARQLGTPIASLPTAHAASLAEVYSYLRSAGKF
ncbi:MAG: class II aldolase/adducin family protein [Actinobacteria bacterium]|nr:class II aldolase/adducin family protein [Actinomycetota bacterium]MCB9389215.1 class II aldolase/adducin family protein [Acidimicrobiia bacterium]